MSEPAPRDTAMGTYGLSARWPGRVLSPGQINVRNMVSKHGRGIGRVRQLGAPAALILTLAFAPSGRAAEAVFPEMAGANEAAKNLDVMAGEKAQLILTLTAATVIEPQLSADLSLVGGTLVAPLVKGVALALQRVGSAQAGVQRFQFSLEIPAAEKPQKLVLDLKVKTTPAETWLPLPGVMLESSPRIWKKTLQQFTGRIPSGRLAGSERLDQLFQQAGIEIPETAADVAVETPRVLVWFADAAAGELRLPAAPAAVVWLVFKQNVPDGLELRRLAPHGPRCLLVDEQALVAAETNPAAQALLARALVFAAALTSAETDLPPP